MTAFARSTITFTDKMASGFVKFLIFYAMLCCHVVRTIGHVPSCGDAERAAGRCARPWAAGAVDVFVFASMSGDPRESRGNAPVYAARNVSALDASFAVPVPAAVRTRGGAVLHAHVFVAPPRRNATWEPRNDTTLASSAYCVGSVELTRPAKVASRRDRPRSLLEGEREERGSTRERNSQLQRLLARPFSTRFGSFLDERSSLGTVSKRGCFFRTRARGTLTLKRR
jgi:hypothetical protein